MQHDTTIHLIHQPMIWDLDASKVVARKRKMLLKRPWRKMKSYREVYGIFKEKSDRWTKIIYCPLLFDAQKILLDTPMHLVHIYYSNALVVPTFYYLPHPLCLSVFYPKMCFCIWTIKLTIQCNTLPRIPIIKILSGKLKLFRLLEMKSVLTALIFGTVHAQECSIPTDLPEGMVLKLLQLY